jgi:hypothetical protein
LQSGRRQKVAFDEACDRRSQLCRLTNSLLFRIAEARDVIVGEQLANVIYVWPRYPLESAGALRRRERGDTPAQ